jgi:hypothetical protein
MDVQYNEQAMKRAMQLAQSEQGQQLFNMLKANHSDSLKQAMNHASKGDYSQAQQILSQLFSDPEAKKLLSQLGGQP